MNNFKEELSDKRFSIGKFQVSKVNLDTAIAFINEVVSRGKTGYVCVSNARVCHLSNNNPEYCAIQNNSLLTVPDGKPLVWIAHNMGFNMVGQVACNELFHAILKESASKGYSHYFYGSTPTSIEKMKERVAKEYPCAKIVGAVSPPFQPIEKYDIDELAEEVNRVAPTFFWVGLGAPKQERLMALLQPKLKSTICIGIGLVFEYYAGTVKRAPEWARKLGLEWIVRDCQQPKRIIKFIPVLSWTLGMMIKTFFHKKQYRQ